VNIIAIRENEDSPASVPSIETIRNRSYPLSAPLVMYYDIRSGSLALRDFVAFCSRRGLGELYAGSKSSKIR
jgi:phosphate transport system substrate-binding protein